MGIKNLKKLIKQHAGGAISDISLSSLRGKKIALVSSILLYKYRYHISTDNFHILGFISKIIELLEFGILPVFVFDGAPPEAKKDTLCKRNDVRENMKERINKLKEERSSLPEINVNVDEFIDDTDEPDREEVEIINKVKKINKEIEQLQKNILYVNKNHSNEVMELLKTLGIPFLKGISEAEETCAYLQRNGFVDYVLTEDTDSLAFGTELVIFGTQLYSLTKILSLLEINFNQFIDLCILCGCDFTCTIPKIGPVNALKLIKKHNSIENLITENKSYIIPDSFDYNLARSIFKENEKFDLNVEFIKKEANWSEFNDIKNKWNISEYFDLQLKKLI
jgi:flap endonuclease-1